MVALSGGACRNGGRAEGPCAAAILQGRPVVNAASATVIIDAHHHIWRQQDLPWLVGPMLPRIFGPYEAIRRDYPISEYLDDISRSGVMQSVYVQANWARENFEDEVAFVQKTADETGW